MKKMSALVMLAFFAISSRREIVFGQSEKENAQLANALTSAKISLEMGMMASEREGQPISAKFEVEDGKLQLSVYTMKGSQFFRGRKHTARKNRDQIAAFIMEGA